MFTAEIATALRRRGHDVSAVVERSDLRRQADEAILATASIEARAIVSNNIRHHVPLFTLALVEGRNHPGLLLTSDHSLPRTKGGTGAIVRALDRVLRERLSEDALTNQLLWLP